jgi:hypothetical protein
LPPRPLAALCAVADRLSATGVEWLLADSAGRALPGYRARPADLEVDVEAGDIAAAARALGAAHRREVGGGRSSLRAHAHLAGVAIDLTAAFEVEGPGGRLGDGFALQREWAEPRRACGRTILVAPVEEAVARMMVLGDRAAPARLAGQAADAGAAPIRPGYVSARLASATATAAR